MRRKRATYINGKEKSVPIPCESMAAIAFVGAKRSANPRERMKQNTELNRKKKLK